MMVLWLLYCQALLLSHRIAAVQHGGAAAAVAHNYDVARQELFCFAGGMAAVARYSMYELDFAMQHLRVRIMCLDTASPAVCEYVRHLELRTAHFLCGTGHGDADRDVDDWKARSGGFAP